MNFDDLPPMARAAYSAALGRARRNGRSWDCLTKEEFAALWVASGGRCQLSGLPFEDTEWEHYSVSRPHCYPFRPSLDRIDNSGGYARGNVRLLSAIANTALSSWPEAAFIEMCRGVAGVAVGACEVHRKG